MVRDTNHRPELPGTLIQIVPNLQESAHIARLGREFRTGLHVFWQVLRCPLLAHIGTQVFSSLSIRSAGRALGTTSNVSYFSGELLAIGLSLFVISM